MIKVKRTLTEKQKEELLYSLNAIYLWASCIDTEFMMYLKDTKFKDPNMNNFAKRIQKDCQSIIKLLNVKTVDDDFAEDRMLELHRTMKFFADKNTGDLREFNNRVDKEYQDNISVA